MALQTPHPLVHQSLSASNRSAEELAHFVNSGTLTLDAPYQRGSVWTEEMRCNLVRSWLMGLPIPAVILNTRPYSDGQPSYACIDGKQRILTAVAWFKSQFAVPASWFEPKMVDRTFDVDNGPFVAYSMLTRTGQRYCGNRFLLPAAFSNVQTVAEEAVIFGLVNGSGVPQDSETLGRAVKVARGLS